MEESASQSDNNMFESRAEDYLSDGSGADLQSKCEIINGFLLGEALPKLGPFPSELESNLTKIIEGLRRLC